MRTFVSLAALGLILAQCLSLSSGNESIEGLEEVNPCLNKHGYLAPMPGSCSGFYFCIEGRAVVNSCGSFLHFNPIARHCDHPARAGCTSQGPLAIDEDSTTEFAISSTTTPLSTDRITTTTPLTTDRITTTTPGPFIPKPQHPLEVVADPMVPTLCKGHSNGVLFPKANSCRHFYVCIEERAFRRSCPLAMHFNPLKMVCQNPIHAHCAFQKKEQTTATATKDANPCANTPTGQLLKHASDCGKFISCSHKRAIEMRCPAGLHFSEALNRCEWPKTAKCQVTKAL